MLRHPRPLSSVFQSVQNVLSGGSLGDRWRKYTQEDQTVSGNLVFVQMRDMLLSGKFWTFDAFRMYNVRLFELYGGNKGAKARPTQKKNELDSEFAERTAKWESDLVKKLDPSVRALRQKIQILDCMNAVELASNHKSIFSRLDRKLIAKRSGVTLKEIDALLLEHDGLRADRKWYQIRQTMNLPLPATMEERDRLSTLDRPFSRSESQLGKQHQDQKRKSAKRSQISPKRISSYVFRTPSKRISRWN